MDIWICNIQLIFVAFFFSLQVRYGQHWAPVHPAVPIEGVMTEIILAAGEVFTEVTADSYRIIDALQFTSNLQTYPVVGIGSAPLAKTVALDGLLYFSGNAGTWSGTRVTQITAHRETCEAP